MAMDVDVHGKLVVLRRNAPRVSVEDMLGAAGSRLGLRSLIVRVHLVDSGRL